MGVKENFKLKHPLIYRRIKAQKRLSTVQDAPNIRDFINKNLDWISTTEGSIFWNVVAYERWGKAKEIAPFLFKSKKDIIQEEGYVIEVNGFCNAK